MFETRTESTSRCYWALGLMGWSILCVQGLLLHVARALLPFDMPFTLFGSYLVGSFVAAGLSSFFAVSSLSHLRFKTGYRVERGLMWLAIVVDASAMLFVSSLLCTDSEFDWL